MTNLEIVRRSIMMAEEYDRKEDEVGSKLIIELFAGVLNSAQHLAKLDMSSDDAKLLLGKEVQAVLSTLNELAKDEGTEIVDADEDMKMFIGLLIVFLKDLELGLTDHGKEFFEALRSKVFSGDFKFSDL